MNYPIRGRITNTHVTLIGKRDYEKQSTEKFREFIPIGEELHKKGGEKLMLQVCERVRSISGDLAARLVESSWDRIGNWLG